MIYRVIMDGNDILNFQERQFTLINPSLTLELNTAGSFEFTMPPSHELYDDVKPLASTISVYEDESLLWFGRPVEIKTDFYKQKAIYCEGALAFFNDTVQRPHEYDRISLHTFFSMVIENHNTQVDADRQFTVGTITIPDKTVYRKLNYDSSFDVLKRQCLGAEGGYLFLRREDGINYIDWYKELPYNCNQPVEFGLNMLDLTGDFDGTSIVTCVIPLGDTVAETGMPLTVASVNNGSDVIESEAVEQYGRITKAVTFNGVSHADTLYEDGLEYLQSTQFNNLTIDGPFTVQAFECRVRSNPIPIIPLYIEEAKGGGFIHDSADSYTRVETIPNIPEILEAAYWNGEHLTQVDWGYEHPFNPDMGLRIASHDMGGISLSLYGIKVAATKNFYGGVYFYPGMYEFKESEPTELEIRSVGTLRVPITDILYSGASQNSAPEWAQTILPEDFQYL